MCGLQVYWDADSLSLAVGPPGAADIPGRVTSSCHQQAATYIYPWMPYMYYLLGELRWNGLETTIGFIYFQGSLVSKEKKVLLQISFDCSLCLHLGATEGSEA